MIENNVTLFTSPKGFSGHAALIQNNALNSWMQPGIAVILLGDDAGVREAAESRGFAHMPSVRRSEYGTPLLDDIFSKAQRAAATPFVCFINADIILPTNFLRVIKSVAAFLPQFLCIGRRWDIPVEETLDFGKDGYTLLESLRLEKGSLYDPTGVDFFVFARGMVTEMPPFCIGRPVWDNWLLWHVKQRRIPVVDITPAMTVYHQLHSYGHIPGGDGKTWEGTPEAQYNYSLITDCCNFKPERQTVFHADFVYTDGRMRKASFVKKFQWDWTTSHAPRLRKFFCGVTRKLLSFATR